eukprot:28103-Eustigmatos_ZCMA.PRE.1
MSEVSKDCRSTYICHVRKLDLLRFDDYEAEGEVEGAPDSLLSLLACTVGVNEVSIRYASVIGMVARALSVARAARLLPCVRLLLIWDRGDAETAALLHALASGALPSLQGIELSLFNQHAVNGTLSALATACEARMRMGCPQLGSLLVSELWRAD